LTRVVYCRCRKRNGPASVGAPRDPAHRKGARTVDTNILRKDRPEGSALTDETPHACIDGWVFLGFEGEDENGELVEIIESMPCRRCRPEDLKDGLGR
jgi:hypothetical protein